MTESISLVYVSLAFALAMAGAGLGAWLTRSHHRLCALISLGAGTLLGVTVFGILPESIESMAWWQIILALGSGYAVFAIITKYVYHVCPACAASHFDEATTHHFSEIATAMMVALGIHCTADGIAIAAGHEAELAHAPGSKALAWSLVLAVCVHKVPEGLALASLLRGAGFSPRASLVRVAAVQCATVFGGVLGLSVLGHLSQFWIAAVVAHAGGGFLFLALHAVFGELFKEHKALVLGNFALGFAIIGTLTLILRTFGGGT